MLKKLLWTVLTFVVLYLLWNYEHVIYGARQGYGQLKVLMEARPIEEYLQDADYPEDKKEKLRLVQEIRQFTIDSLGLNESGSYRKMFDQQGKPLLWTVTACQPFALEAKEWTFPILGTFSYKGFFEYDLAQKEQRELDKDGWDTRIGEVSAWSTLGVLNDPILSSTLDRNIGSLTQLVIHELTHGTLYIKNNVTYNENLADFVGDEGAKLFLAYKYGVESEEYQRYLNRKEDRKKFSEYILSSTNRLDSLYSSFDETIPLEEKKLQKEQLITEIMKGLITVDFYNKNYYTYFQDFQPNNTFFMSYKRYRERQNQFREQFEQEFDSDFQAYFKYLKETYKPLF
ncbi:aminopeptidase [Algivirga pacifica]|uniref:Aminopeptidase n=1 Tax=Algivirga pacifica TaxID=1162670 RepID=A0ABP9D5V4_9BACT